MPKKQITQLKNEQKIQTNISPKTYRWAKSTCLQTINAGEAVEKREPFYLVSRNVNWYNHYRTVCRFLKKLKIELPL